VLDSLLCVGCGVRALCCAVGGGETLFLVGVGFVGSVGWCGCVGGSELVRGVMQR